METTEILCGTPRIDLAGEWKLEGSGSDGAPVSYAAAVPGDVHTALFAAGAIPDPFFGRNERDVQWVGQREWTFSRSFDVPAEFLSHSSVVLRLEDCDTFASAFVNGIEIGKAGNRFRRWDFDAKAALRPGRNEIHLVFASAWAEGDRLAALSDKPYPMSNSEIAWFNNGSFIRKPACHRGWDWGLAQLITGPCGKVELIASDGDRIDYVFCDQMFSSDLSHCTLRVNAVLETGEMVSNTIEIDDPPLWWPAGQGPQQFLEIEVALDGKSLQILGCSKISNLKSQISDIKSQVSDRQSRNMRFRIGLRKLEIDTAGGAMTFVVNNRPIFMKGANWIPCDAFDSRQTPERYRDLLQSAIDANMNMVRLWGGGQFEKDCFYDICDELGILVWHDFMFSCAVYPATEDFLAEIRAETEHQVRRLRDHACIALWCGDNECIGAARGWFEDIITPETRPQYIAECRKRFEVLEDVVSRCDPSRRFWPSSPCAGVADFDHDAWHTDGKGDMHIWTVWHENKPFSDYRNYRPRFCSEFGYQSFPSKEIAETFCPPGKAASGEPDFEWHQKNMGGNDRLRGSLERLFRKPKDADAILYLSQVQQAVGIKTAVEAWRSLRPQCMGTLYWQLNDLWPVSSWSSVEYGGKWKHLHYHARRFYEPVAIVAKPSEDGSSLGFWALNDTPGAVEAEARVRLFGFGGESLGEETMAVSLPPGSASLIASRPLEAYGTQEKRTGRFIEMELIVGDLPSMVGGDFRAPRRAGFLHRNEWFFSPFRDCPLEKANLEISLDSSRTSRTSSTSSASSCSSCSSLSGLTLTLTADKPAFFVWANAKGIRGEFSDNSFTLLPGEPREIVFVPKGGCPSADDFRRALSVTHLRAATE